MPTATSLPATNSHPIGDDTTLAVDQRYSREYAHGRIIRLARALLPITDRITDEFVHDLSNEVGIAPAAFRTLFPTNDDLLREVNQHLIQECMDRLRVLPDGVLDGTVDLATAARSLATAWPIDWAGVTIRAKERAAALTNPQLAQTVLSAERSYAPAILEVLVELLRRTGRRFSWPPLLAARVVLLTYERSFEAWLMSGANERAFPESPYVRETLPRLLDQITEPLVDAP